MTRVHERERRAYWEKKGFYALGNSLIGGARGSYRTLECHATEQIQSAKQKIHHRNCCQTAFLSLEAIHKPQLGCGGGLLRWGAERRGTQILACNRGWGGMLRLWQHPRERSGTGSCEETLQGLLWHSCRIRHDWHCQSRRCLRQQKKHYDSVKTPEVAATTRLCVGIHYYPHFAVNLNSLALPRVLLQRRNQFWFHVGNCYFDLLFFTFLFIIIFNSLPQRILPLCLTVK